jgi:polyferredoxin
MNLFSQKFNLFLIQFLKLKFINPFDSILKIVEILLIYYLGSNWFCCETCDRTFHM